MTNRTSSRRASVVAPLPEPSGPSRVSVAVRKRPLNEKETGRADSDVIRVNGPNVTVFEPKTKVDLTRYVDQHEFEYDAAFSEGSSNAEVYDVCVRPLVNFVLEGGRGTCFAFGQTGSGKTHTMLGSAEQEPGLYLLAVDEIFRNLQTSGRDLWVSVGFFEIYGDDIHDLLNERSKLVAREDGARRVRIVGLKDVKVENPGEVLEVMEYGSVMRSTGSTGANAGSSRSHAVLQLTLHNASTNRMHSRLSFIDLAGSERGADTYDNEKKTRLEGAQINKSLLALKECIRAMDNRQSHTPFRSSKLTQVLKDSFTGNGRTAMIANIAPTSTACENTLNTLRYAERVKQLRKGGSGGAGSNSAASTPRGTPPRKGLVAADVDENAHPNLRRTRSQPVMTRPATSLGLATRQPRTPEEPEAPSPGDMSPAESEQGMDVSPPSPITEAFDAWANKDDDLDSLAGDAPVANEEPHPPKRPRVDGEADSPVAEPMDTNEEQPSMKTAGAELLAAFKKELGESMVLMEREVALLSEMESVDAHELPNTTDSLAAIVQQKMTMCQEMQRQLDLFQKRSFATATHCS